MTSVGIAITYHVYEFHETMGRAVKEESFAKHKFVALKMLYCVEVDHVKVTFERIIKGADKNYGVEILDALRTMNASTTIPKKCQKTINFALSWFAKTEDSKFIYFVCRKENVLGNGCSYDCTGPSNPLSKNDFIEEYRENRRRWGCPMVPLLDSDDNFIETVKSTGCRIL